jgi:hypothetical protein
LLFQWLAGKAGGTAAAVARDEHSCNRGDHFEGGGVSLEDGAWIDTTVAEREGDTD